MLTSPAIRVGKAEWPERLGRLVTHPALLFPPGDPWTRELALGSCQCCSGAWDDAGKVELFFLPFYVGIFRLFAPQICYSLLSGLQPSCRAILCLWIVSCCFCREGMRDRDWELLFHHFFNSLFNWFAFLLLNFQDVLYILDTIYLLHMCLGNTLSLFLVFLFS